MKRNSQASSQASSPASSQATILMSQSSEESTDSLSESLSEPLIRRSTSDGKIRIVIKDTPPTNIVLLQNLRTQGNVLYVVFFHGGDYHGEMKPVLLDHVPVPISTVVAKGILPIHKHTFRGVRSIPIVGNTILGRYPLTPLRNNINLYKDGETMFDDKGFSISDEVGVYVKDPGTGYLFRLAHFGSDVVIPRTMLYISQEIVEFHKLNFGASPTCEIVLAACLEDTEKDTQKVIEEYNEKCLFFNPAFGDLSPLITDRSVDIADLATYKLSQHGGKSKTKRKRKRSRKKPRKSTHHRRRTSRL